MQGGDEVEVLFAGFVVAEEFALQDVFEEFGGEVRVPVRRLGLALRTASSSVL